ncbi:hypothetical protein JCM8208_004392 [Rhodotorula glutinis]
MLDRLPYELIRRILDEAHPPFANSSSDSPFTAASHARLRFLSNVERTCKSVQGVAHDLLWHTVWIRPASSAKQLDRLLDPNRGESSRVRVFNLARHVERMASTRPWINRASVTQALSKVDKVVEISLRGFEGGTVDFGELLQRQCLRTLIIESDNLEVLLDTNLSIESVILPNLRHLTLENVRLSSSINGLFTRRHFPVLETVSIQRILVDYTPAFPEIELELQQQLKSINVALDEWQLCQPVVGGKVERVLVHLNGRIARNIEYIARTDAIPWSPSSVHRGVKNLVLTAEEVVLHDDVAPELLNGTVRLASLLVQSGFVTTLFRAVTFRHFTPARMLLPGSRTAKQLWKSLKSECSSRNVGIHSLRHVADFESWPTWAQENPSLRRMVAVLRERDLRREEKARRGRTGRA